MDYRSPSKPTEHALHLDNAMDGIDGGVTHINNYSNRHGDVYAWHRFHMLVERHAWTSGVGQRFVDAECGKS